LVTGETEKKTLAKIWCKCFVLKAYFTCEPASSETFCSLGLITMTSLFVISFLTAVAATLIAYVIGRWGRTSSTAVTSSMSVPVTKETACQADQEETVFGVLLNCVLLTLCLTLSCLCFTF